MHVTYALTKSGPQKTSQHCAMYKSQQSRRFLQRNSETWKLAHRQATPRHNAHYWMEGKSAPATYCPIARIAAVLDGGDSVHRATYCAIAQTAAVLDGGDSVHRATSCAIAQTAAVLDGGDSVHRATYCAIAQTAAVLDGGNSVHRATYCAHNYPLPLLPSGPGGVGGITSRRTRHSFYFTTQKSTPPTQRPNSRTSNGATAPNFFNSSSNSTHPSP
jgi:hypothetical protein